MLFSFEPIEFEFRGERFQAIPLKELNDVYEDLKPGDEFVDGLVFNCIKDMDGNRVFENVGQISAMPGIARNQLVQFAVTVNGMDMHEVKKS